MLKRKLFNNERFYYGAVILTVVLAGLWLKLTPPIQGLLILFVSAIVLDVAQTYSKSMIKKKQVRDKFNMQHITKIAFEDSGVLEFILLITPFFILSYFNIISLDTTYFLAIFTSIIIFFKFGYTYGSPLNASIPKKIFYGFLNALFAISIMILKSFID